MADTNRISDVWADLVTHVRSLEGTTDLESSTPVRLVAEGELLAGWSTKPSLNLWIERIGRSNRWDSGWVWTVHMRFRLTTYAINAGRAINEILRKAAQVQNHLDGYARPDGVTGLDAATWNIAYSGSPDAGQEVTASMETQMAVNVGPSEN